MMTRRTATTATTAIVAVEPTSVPGTIVASKGSDCELARSAANELVARLPGGRASGFAVHRRIV